MSKEMLEAAKKMLLEAIDPEFLMVFGSYATGEVHPNSDLDLAFLKEGNELSAYDVFMIAQRLSNLINIKVDLIDLSQASTVFKMQIFDKGKLLFAKDVGKFNAYEMTTLRMYVDLNEKRDELLKEIHERGSVYGTRSRYYQK